MQCPKCNTEMFQLVLIWLKCPTDAVIMKDSIQSFDISRIDYPDPSYWMCPEHGYVLRDEWGIQPPAEPSSSEVFYRRRAPVDFGA